MNNPIKIHGTHSVADANTDATANTQHEWSLTLINGRIKMNFYSQLSILLEVRLADALIFILL